MNRHCLSLAIAGLLAMAPAWSSAADIEGRVTRIENMLDNQRGSDLTLQVQGMQRELQRLRGLVEQQKYELENLKRAQGGPAPEGATPLDGPVGQGTGEPAVPPPRWSGSAASADSGAGPGPRGCGGETARGYRIKGAAALARRDHRAPGARGDPTRRGDPAPGGGAGPHQAGAR